MLASIGSLYIIKTADRDSMARGHLRSIGLGGTPTRAGIGLVRTAVDPTGR